MPPWSSRLLSPSSRPELRSNANTASLGSPDRTRTPQRITESDIIESAYDIPTLPPPSRGFKPPRTPSHGRSMSHPFPSLFSGKKKRQDDPDAPLYESTDDDSNSTPLGRNTAYAANPKHKVPEKDLTSGKCMTCDSTVRWPKNLKVFRCTVCMTINDLKPVALEARGGDGHRAPTAGKFGTFPGSSGSQKVIHLSLEKTKRLVDQCINSYLLNRLKHDDGLVSSPTQSPLRSPVLSPAQIYSEKELSEIVAADNPNPQPPIFKTPAVHLSRRPVGLADESSASRAARRHEFSGADPGPYSTSSPGSFFSAHMEQRKRNTNQNWSNDPRGGAGGAVNLSLSEKEKIDLEGQIRTTTGRHIFKPLEDYIITSFGSFECVNNSFTTLRPNLAARSVSEGVKRWVPSPPETRTQTDMDLSELDAKTLLLGDFAENGSWWTGGCSDTKSTERSRMYRKGPDSSNDSSDLITVKSPRVDWAEVDEWYDCVLNSGRTWRRTLNELIASGQPLDTPSLSVSELEEIQEQITEAQHHTQRILLKATESLLKRPGRPLKEPRDIRFLLIILANPLLYPSHTAERMRERSRSRSPGKKEILKTKGSEAPKLDTPLPSSPNARKGTSGQHSGIIKRILGLLSNLPNDCHHHLVSWFARYSDGHFQRTVDLIGSFVTYRLTRQHGKQREIKQDSTADLIPSMSGSGRSTSAALHAALGISGQPAKRSDGKPQPLIYNDDWQIKAGARVMALLFSANNSGLVKKNEIRPTPITLEAGRSAGLAARERAHNHGQILPTSDFYNTLLDYSDLIVDFEAWEARRGKFAFCQYPFFLSIWAKIQIMEHDARRQMEVKAREAFFDSIMTRKTVNQYLVLKIRRECLIEDSLKSVSEVVGTGGEEIKKGLRIEFKGEEGIDAGGLRKEWFLLLVRDVFNPEHGMFTYDEDSQFCYFNPNSFETTDQFFLVGVVLGLAIYNSTILDVAFPPFAFRKLLAAGPAAAPGATSHAKPSMTYSLDDLTEYRPSLASGLRQLLEFEGDVETTFCRDFVADIERYGQMIQVPLCPDGEKRAVTNSNRREFVDLYVRYLLDTAVARQFEPFKRGFFTVCGGNALSLFRPEEIELLIRGSDEPLDIASLRAVSTCENWGVLNAAETEPVVIWFWQSFQSANPKDQRKLLSFITGSDRIPAMGATNLVIKISCLGDDSCRFPVARTCFNMLSLWRYSSKAKLENMLWRAVNESEGFGLK